MPILTVPVSDEENELLEDAMRLCHERNRSRFVRDLIAAKCSSLGLKAKEPMNRKGVRQAITKKSLKNQKVSQK